MAKAVYSRGKNTQNQRPREAQSQKGRGQKGRVPQGARDHEEAASRETCQAVVRLHYRRAHIHCN